MTAGVSGIASAQQTVGLFQNDAEAFKGLTLFNLGGMAYLIDNAGLFINMWVGGDWIHPGYLLDNGNLLIMETGSFRETTWDSTNIWSFTYPTMRHDIEPLPNGNVLIIAQESFTTAEVLDAGRDPSLLENGLSPLIIIEVAFPGTVVWEWRLWNHLVQDYDASKPNYGVVAEAPELVDLNYVNKTDKDWIHANALDFNDDLHQIVVTARNFNEFWIIDHSTSTAQAATSAGGNSGRGGDILYRWGNPMTYGAGTLADRQLFGPHDAQWIESGLQGAGNIMIFNNGGPAFGGPRPRYSSIVEITTPTDRYRYSLTPGSAYLPAAPVWTYRAIPSTNFFSPAYSGAQRLPNGNTLITEGTTGTLFEVTALGDTVWKYVNPLVDKGPLNWDETPGQANIGQVNGLFRVYRYPFDHPAFVGKNLTPGSALEIWSNTANLTMQSGANGSQVSRPEGTYAYGVGQLVTLTAEADAGYEFTGWSVPAGTAAIADPTARHTTFKMGASDTTVQANFTRIFLPVPVPTLSFWGAPLALLLLLSAFAAIRSNKPA